MEQLIIQQGRLKKTTLLRLELHQVMVMVNKVQHLPNEDTKKKGLQNKQKMALQVKQHVSFGFVSISLQETRVQVQDQPTSMQQRLWTFVHE